MIGHYVPVPAETGWTDGDLEDKYISARYRVLMSKDQYDRDMAYIRDLQSRSHTWSAELYNCNAFVADIAKDMGLKVPASTLIYPKVFITHLRMMNTGHPDADGHAGQRQRQGNEQSDTRRPGDDQQRCPHHPSRRHAGNRYGGSGAAAGADVSAEGHHRAVHVSTGRVSPAYAVKSSSLTTD